MATEITIRTKNDKERTFPCRSLGKNHPLQRARIGSGPLTPDQRCLLQAALAARGLGERMGGEDWSPELGTIWAESVRDGNNQKWEAAIEELAENAYGYIGESKLKLIKRQIEHLETKMTNLRKTFEEKVAKINTEIRQIKLAAGETIKF